jgi:predicted O-linked N-acetylglucosamine transferase (SPINDLY family)
MAEPAGAKEGGAPGAVDLYLQAKAHFNAGRFPEAIRCLTHLRVDQAYTVRAEANIGSSLLMLGLSRPALKFLDRALRRDPHFLPAVLSRLKALRLLQRDEEIVDLCGPILECWPQEEEVWNLWVAALRGTGREERALEVVGLWLSHQPKSLEGHLLKAELLSNRGDNEQAVACLGRALRLDPSSGKVYEYLSVVMIRTRRHEAALQYLEKALAINPDSCINHCRKAMVLWLTADWREAAVFYGKVAAMRPNSAIYRLNHHLLLPGIPASGKDIEEARRRFVEGLSLVENEPELEFDLKDEAIPHTFALAYHNSDDRRLLERYNDLMRQLARPLLQEIRQHQASVEQALPTPRKAKRRIGFLSQFFSGHSNTIAFSGLIRHLDRERFEVLLIHTSNSKRDAARDSLDAVCDRALQLPPEFAAAYVMLLSEGLDILFFTDLGMNSYEYILPFLRTAPIQMTGWGIPHTSGIREIDYYISAEGLEPDGSEDSYTETLVRLPVGLPCHFETTELSFTPLPREYFFLPPGDTLVGCLQGLHKLHPDFDLLLEKIARANPEVAFVFVEDSIPSRTRLFLERLSRNAPSARERCIPLACMGRHEYHSLCNCINVLLDPIYYGCGITFFEASFVGTPIVTLEGTNLRSRVVASGYREMGINDPPIARNEEEYVSLVTALCNDPERLLTLKASILANNKRVFDRMDYIRHFEAFCLEAMHTQCKQET